MAEAPLVQLFRPEPARPILLTGLGAAAVLSGTGDLSLRWEARGADLEWGGAYAQGVRLTGPWTTRFLLDDHPYDTPGTLRRLSAFRSRIETTHEFGSLVARQQIVALAEEPAIARQWEFQNVGGGAVDLRVTSEWSPYLSPVIVEAFKPYEYQAEVDGTAPRFKSGNYVVSLHTDPAPETWLVNGTSWNGDKSEGEVGSVAHESRWRIAPGRCARADWLLRGGIEKFVKLRSADAVGFERRDTWAIDAARSWIEWLESTPQLSLPDAPALQQAYELARGGLRALYTRPEPTLTGMVAGYPWYSTIWCRDLAWELPAVLWMGDFVWAEASIDSVLRYQAPESILILSAEKGELPMQLSAGPVFIFGTSDTTHHYPDLVRRLVDHSGDLELARRFYPAVERAIAWGTARVDPSSHLVRNGGELERMMALAKLTGRFEYGIDAHDTTIWDSIDRRDHAIDIQVLWHHALRAYGRLSELVGRADNAEISRQTDAVLLDAVRDRYWWEEEGYLVDTVRNDGTVSRKVRPNALRAVATGALPPAKARRLLSRAQQSDLFAPWGLRTLSNRDPAFVPTAYHDGQVWSIATAWGADAAFAAGDAEAGLRFQSAIADRIVAESGYANECYRGDRPVPFNSCFLLGFSVAPFLSNFFEGLWGLRPDAPAGALRVAPCMPSRWRSAELRGLRVGPGRVDLRYSPGQLAATWRGPGALKLLGADGTPTLLADGVPETIALQSR